jgi:hypothetical protein
MKNIIVVLLMVNVVPLCAMEIEIYNKKSEFAMDVESQKFDDCSPVKNALLFVKTMQERGNITKDVAGAIVYKSCLLRKDSIYKQFDPFFHFDNDNYAKMTSDYNEEKSLIYAPFNDLEIKHFEEIFSIALLRRCRKFDILKPHHLIFLTEKQDEILSSLIARPECFHACKGTYSFKMTEKEHQSFLMLPPELIELLSIYPMFASFKSSDSDMDVIF